MTQRTLRPSLPAIFSSRRHFLKVAHVQWSTPEGERVYQGREPRAGRRAGARGCHGDKGDYCGSVVRGEKSASER